MIISFVNIMLRKIILSFGFIHGETTIFPIFYIVEALFLFLTIGYILFSIKHKKLIKLFIFIFIHVFLLLMFFIGIYEAFNNNILIGFLAFAYIVPIAIIAIIQWRESNKDESQNLTE